MKHLLPASAILALLFATPAPAATDDSTLAARLLRELELLRTQQQSGVQSHYAKTMSDLNAGAVSGVTAVDIFEESIKATDFEGKKRDSAEFLAWRKENHDKLHSREFEEAARLHFNWLVLTIKRAHGAKIETLADGIRKHCSEVNDLLDNLKEGEKVDLSLLNGKVRSGKIVDYLNLDRIINPPNSLLDNKWPDSAGNVDGIMAATLLPLYREAKDRRLITYWDDRIARVERRSDKVQLAAKQQEVLTEQIPALRWSRAEDLLELGDRRTAIQEMFNLVKTYPMHPQFEAWCGKLKPLLEEAASATDKSETPAEPAVSPAPETPPPAAATRKAPAYFGTPTPPAAPAASVAPAAPAPTPAPAAPATSREPSRQEAELQGETQ